MSIQVKITKKHLTLLYLSFFIFILPYKINSTEVSDLIKRSVMVIPFNNETGAKDLENIGLNIHETLKRALLENFTVIDSEKNNIAFNYGSDPASYKNTADETGLSSGVDLVIYGRYYAQNDNVFAQAFVYDVPAAENIFDETVKFRPGLEKYKGITGFASRAASKAFEEGLKYKKKILDIISTGSGAEESRKRIVKKLADQPDKKWFYVIDVRGTKRSVKIPFAKNAVIFVCDQTPNFSVQSEGELYDEPSNIKMIFFDDQKGAKREFVILQKDKKPVQFSYVQTTENEVAVKHINFTGLESPGKYLMYADVLLHMSTGGYIGIDIKTGLGLPLRSGLENNIYLRLAVAPKAVNAVKVGESIRLDHPHLKLKFGFGFEHVFFIRNMFGIHVGMEIGTELNFLAFLIRDGERISAENKMIFGLPSAYYSFPFGFQFFVTKRVGMVLTIEPILRFVINVFAYRNNLFFEDLDETRGAGFEFLRLEAAYYLVADMFLYDMPVTLGMRIKI